MNKTPQYLSIVIASYNSAQALQKNLGVLFDYLAKQSYSYEVILVDDGSFDKGLTESIAYDYGCTYIKHNQNRGKGAAVKTGMLAAQGAFRVFTDADIPYQPQVIETLLHYLDFKEFDMAVGDRTVGGNNYYNQVTLTRSFASKIFSFIVGRFIAGGIFDTQCGIKGFRAKAANEIFNSTQINGFAFDVEVFHIGLIRNYDIKRVPVQLRSQDGKSVRVFSNGIGMLIDLFRILIHKY